jgi:hypothetical protein
LLLLLLLLLLDEDGEVVEDTGDGRSTTIPFPF